MDHNCYFPAVSLRTSRAADKTDLLLVVGRSHEENVFGTASCREVSLPVSNLASSISSRTALSGLTDSSTPGKVLLELLAASFGWGSIIFTKSSRRSQLYSLRWLRGRCVVDALLTLLIVDFVDAAEGFAVLVEFGLLFTNDFNLSS